jgi:hypothetical protein
MANDVRRYGAVPDGTTDCINAINTGLLAGDVIIQNGVFLISASIKIPSNKTVYIKNAKIKMANSSYDNFFRNSDFSGGNNNINIIGQGMAILDGNSANNDDDYATYGLRTNSSYRYIGIIFCNVTTFSISGIQVADHPHWTIYLQKSSFGSVHDIYINQYLLTVNQDGIDMGHGSHDIEIYNIKGYTRDDVFAIIVSNYSDLAVRDIPDWNKGNVYNIDYHDVDIYNCAQGSTLALIAGDGGKIYNIDQESMRIRTGGTIWFSNYTGYWDVDPVKGDTHDITMNNITMDNMSVGRDYLFYFGQSCMDVTATNITNNTGEPMYTLIDGDQSDNVTINGAQVV